MERIKELEENLTKLSQKYNKLEQKRTLEVEGFKDEIRRLKSQSVMRIRPDLLSYKLDYESSEIPEKQEHLNEEKNTKIISKEDNKATKKKDFVDYHGESSPEKEIVQERVKKEDHENSVDESVNLEELEHIKVNKSIL